MKPGWNGRFYEDFEVGDVYKHPNGRTITQAENIAFSLATQALNPIHFNSDYAKNTEWGRPLVISTLALSLVTGMSVQDLSQNAINLGWEEVRLPAPLFEGETLYAESEVLAKRESKSRPNMGIVNVKTKGYTQDGKIVIEYKRSFLVYKRGHSPWAVVKK